MRGQETLWLQRPDLKWQSPCSPGRCFHRAMGSRETSYRTQMDPNLGSHAKSRISNRMICEQIVGMRDRGRNRDPLLAKTVKIIYLIGSFGVVLCRSARFCT